MCAQEKATKSRDSLGRRDTAECAMLTNRRELIIAVSARNASCEWITIVRG